MASTSDWAVFLDDFNGTNKSIIPWSGHSYWQKTPPRTAIIANERVSGQDAVNNQNRLFGFTAAFHDSHDATANWDRLILNKQVINNKKTDVDKAKQILATVYLYADNNPDNLPTDDRGPASLSPAKYDPKNPTKRSGGQWWYAQNFQVEKTINMGTKGKDELAANAKDANAAYAQVTAILWAFNKVYGDPSGQGVDFVPVDVVPVFDSYFVKSLGNFSIQGINANLKQLGLDGVIVPITESAPATKTKGYTNNWNFISTLYNSQLIDGFIGDSFTPGQEGSLPPDALSIYQSNIPYAMDSNFNHFPEYTENGKFVSHFYDGNGSMPVRSSVWFGTEEINGQMVTGILPWDAAAEVGFLPDKYYSIKQKPLGDNNTLGTDNADKITGTDLGDHIHGLGGDDALVAGAGNDQLNGNGGNDVLFGGKGDDLLFGGSGDDDHYGGKGADIFYLSAGDDTIHDFSIEEGDKVFHRYPDSLSVNQLSIDWTDLMSVYRSPNGGLRLESEDGICTTLVNVSLASFLESNSFAQ